MKISTGTKMMTTILSASSEFDPDMYKYEDYKDFMTEEEFNEFVDEMKKYYEEYEKKAS